MPPYPVPCHPLMMPVGHHNLRQKGVQEAPPVSPDIPLKREGYDIKLKINIPAKAKKSREVKSLMEEALFLRKKANCSEVTPQ